MVPVIAKQDASTLIASIERNPLALAPGHRSQSLFASVVHVSGDSASDDNAPGPCDAMSPFDVVAALASALPSTWSVERECDPDGDLSIVVLPDRDEPAQPSFVLYEEDGLVQVGTVIGDAWHGKRTFPTCRRAVGAIVAMAVPPGC
jgi:hypothetical protein